MEMDFSDPLSISYLVCAILTALTAASEILGWSKCHANSVTEAIYNGITLYKRCGFETKVGAEEFICPTYPHCACISKYREAPTVVAQT